MKIDWCLEPKTVELKVGSYDLYTTIKAQFYIMPFFSVSWSSKMYYNMLILILFSKHFFLLSMLETA